MCETRKCPYPKLFSPLKVGSITLRNRIVAAPITKYGLEPSPADELELVAAKARGGAGLVILGSCAVNDEESLIYFEGSSLDGRKRPLYNEEISVIHQYGAKAAVQLLHCGMWADLRGKTCSPVGPDTMARVGNYQGLEGIENNQIMDGRIINGLDEAGMDRICRQYVHSALTAKKMGFDMVMLHFAHGWLMAEFLSPFFNHRTDEYGGSFENRIRFPMRIVKAVREAVGKDYPLDMRIGAEEYVDGGLKPEEVIEFIRRVEDQIDLVHISSGLDKFAEQTTYIESPSLYPHQINVKYAEMAKKVLKIPVVTVGGITMPEEAEEILESQKADAIALGRALIADPDWPEKARNGERGEIASCLRCCSCYGVATDGISQGCAVNPRSGRALRLKTEEAFLPRGKRHVVVIGGGPAGMQAAITAAEKGHRVTLLEKEQELGGLLKISDHDEEKMDMRNFKNHLIHCVQNREITLRLGCEATPEMVRDLGADKIIVAVGSEPVMLRLPGMEGEHVLDIVEAHKREQELGNQVVIIGAGPSGCELALSLAKTGRNVTIVEQTGQMAAAGNHLYRSALSVCMREHPNIRCLLKTSFQAVTSDGVLAENQKQGQLVIPADHVVCAVGMRPKRALAESFQELGYDVSVIGDCVSPRRINEAVHEGFFAGWRS
ncbi:MAG: FAD-dependent oxidoreductase [Candidatus Limivivens sp.]|nr:FAD-dependent oxidoreductase [Candidatus Limivivens sp.]